MGVKVAFRDEVQELANRSAVTIPREALRKDEGRDVVFVVNDESVERRAVTVSAAAGTVEDEEVLILAGVTAGEQVVVEGPSDLKEGDLVEVRAE
jgi:multidrug efflux pump subunit AcrA (membrane-fusion protein)